MQFLLLIKLPSRFKIPALCYKYLVKKFYEYLFLHRLDLLANYIISIIVKRLTDLAELCNLQNKDAIRLHTHIT